MKVFLALTGASGSIYGLRLAEELLKSGISVTLSASTSGIAVCRLETGIDLSGDNEAVAAMLTKHWQTDPGLLVLRAADDLWAAEASGSSAADVMFVAPCSMGSLARIAAGFSGNLIERAADVMLKESRQLVLLPRETPFSAIHLKNMLALAEMGARIVPAMPGFYHQPASMADLVDFVVGKLLDQADIPHNLFKRWGTIA